ncbi:AMP-binding protein (plasmid) [Variovorax sp. PDNC026]|nr:AMP-binding protein [Variovorax sp. PDNC026]
MAQGRVRHREPRHHHGRGHGPARSGEPAPVRRTGRALPRGLGHDRDRIDGRLQPQADAEAFREIDGRRFLRTGDLVHRDAEGYLFIVDRLKRLIRPAA